MDIGSKEKYPANALSNFAPHPFVFDGVACNSMEGLLQSFKTNDQPIQEHICTLVGIGAKRRGRNINWWKAQTLYWKGVAYPRESKGYQELLTRAYDALGKNSSFRKALLASRDAVLRHSIGTKEKGRTILTEQEFCSQLTRLRSILQDEEREAKLQAQKDVPVVPQLIRGKKGKRR